MIKSRRVAAALALAAAGPFVLQAPAHASDFQAEYTCTVPGSGDQTGTVTGSLTATPNPSTVGTATTFALHVATETTSPLTINSWTATVDIDVTGAETTTFQMSGSGGQIPANEPIAVDLESHWTPSSAGTDEFFGGNVTINASTILGEYTVPCTPSEPRPVAETLAVN